MPKTQKEGFEADESKSIKVIGKVKKVGISEITSLQRETENSETT